MEQYVVVATSEKGSEKKVIERVDNWEAIRDTYVYSKTKQTLAWVARKHGVPYYRAWWHYKNEDWPGQREAFWIEYRARKKEIELAENLRRVPVDEMDVTDDTP